MDCDIRFAADKAVFATAFVRRGLNAEYGSSWKLPRIVGHGRASELLLSGRKFDAAEADRIGLVSGLFPADRLLPETLAYATDMAVNCSPIAMADVKFQLDRDWTLGRREAQDGAKIMSHEPGHRVDFAEGVISYKEKRPPAFAPLPDRSGDGR
jgi:enoyl-CoA hydratase/carnithine racemase